MESIFISVVRLCERKIISRLKCKDWIAPAYYYGKRQERRLGKADRLFYGIPLQRAESRHLTAAWYMSRSVRM